MSSSLNYLFYIQPWSTGWRTKTPKVEWHNFLHRTSWPICVQRYSLVCTWTPMIFDFSYPNKWKPHRSDTLYYRNKNNVQWESRTYCTCIWHRLNSIPRCLPHVPNQGQTQCYTRNTPERTGNLYPVHANAVSRHVNGTYPQSINHYTACTITRQLCLSPFHWQKYQYKIHKSFHSVKSVTTHNTKQNTGRTVDSGRARVRTIYSHTGQISHQVATSREWTSIYIQI